MDSAQIVIESSGYGTLLAQALESEFPEEIARVNGVRIVRKSLPEQRGVVLDNLGRLAVYVFGKLAPHLADRLIDRIIEETKKRDHVPKTEFHIIIDARTQVTFNLPAHAEKAKAYLRDQTGTNEPRQEPAKRGSWKADHMPKARERIAFDRTFTLEEFARIQLGHIPKDMDDKWFVYWEDNWLFIHRSWTGHCIYQLRLDKGVEGFRVAEAWVNRDRSQYASLDAEEDCQILTKVLEWSLGI